MSLADLRKELREIRKSEVRPVSRMKKHEVVMELEKRKGGKKVEKVESESEAEEVKPKVAKSVKKVEKVLEKAEAPAKVVKKAAAKMVEAKKAEPKKKSK